MDSNPGGRTRASRGRAARNLPRTPAAQPYRSYTNYLSADDYDRVRQAYGPDDERLVQLNRRYDPDNLFLALNLNIDPRGLIQAAACGLTGDSDHGGATPPTEPTRCSARRSICAGARSARTSALPDEYGDVVRLVLWPPGSVGPVPRVPSRRGQAVLTGSRERYSKGNRCYRQIAASAWRCGPARASTGNGSAG